MGNSLRVTSLVSAIGFALLGAPIAFAAPGVPGAEKVVSATQAGERGVYIVRFVEPGLLNYSGGAPGLSATAPTTLAQRKLDVHSAASTAYSGYLETQRAAHVAAITQALGRALDVPLRY